MLKNNKWVPTFPNAKYLVGGTEWDFFSRAEDPFMKDPVDDSVRPIMAEGMSELVDDKYKITDEIWLESTPIVATLRPFCGPDIFKRSGRSHRSATLCIIRFNVVIPEWDDV